MNRLTKYNYFDDTLYFDTKEQFTEYNLNLYKKVKIYEDIEEKLGCPIELYYKMCIEGTELYSLPHSDVIQWRHQYIYHKDFEGNAVFCLMLNSSLTPLYYVKDYGKTWALTREELENAN